MNKIKIILASIIVVLIVFVTILIYMKPKKSNNVEATKKTTETVLQVENYNVLRRVYSGQISLDSFEDDLRKYATEYMPAILESTKGMDEQQIASYYQENKDTIASQLWIYDSNNFSKMIKYIRDKSKYNLNVKNINIELSDYQEASNFANFKVYFNIGNDESIVFAVKLKIKYSQKEKITFIPVTEE